MTDNSREAGHLALIVAAVAGGIMLIAAIFAMFDDKGSSARASAAVAANTPSTYYVTRMVRMRDAPSAEGSNIIATLQRGETVEGVMTKGRDGVTPWLRVERPGTAGYVWGKNLSTRPRPALTSSIGRAWTINRTSVIRAEPEFNSALLDTVQPGLKVDVVGGVTNDQVEIALREGGVGYLPSYSMQPY